MFYSQIPDHMLHFQYLFYGLEGKGQLVPIMWFAIVGMTVAALLMINPEVRKNEKTLAWVCGLIIITTYLDKGLGLMTGGFVPNPLEKVGNTGRRPPKPSSPWVSGPWASSS